jgi:hypothetical protein
MTDFFDDLERQLVAATPQRAGRVRRARARRAAALSTTLVALLACGAGIAAAVDGDDGGGSAASPATTATAPAPTPTGPRAIDPDRSTYTVAVLNGTSTPGLARGVANRLQNARFKIGNVTNAATQRRTATTVYFAREQDVAAATQVAETLSLGDTTLRPMARSVRLVAGDQARVVVLVGSDQNTSPAP